MEKLRRMELLDSEAFGLLCYFSKRWGIFIDWDYGTYYEELAEIVPWFSLDMWQCKRRMFGFDYEEAMKLHLIGIGANNEHITIRIFDNKGNEIK